MPDGSENNACYLESFDSKHLAGWGIEGRNIYCSITAPHLFNADLAKMHLKKDRAD
jgi:hypothetical protein